MAMAGYDPSIGWNISVLGEGGPHAAGIGISGVYERTLWSSSGQKPSEWLIIGELSTKAGGVGGWKTVGDPSFGAFAFGNLGKVWFVGGGWSISMSPNLRPPLSR